MKEVKNVFSKPTAKIVSSVKTVTCMHAE